MINSFFEPRSSGRFSLLNLSLSMTNVVSDFDAVTSGDTAEGLRIDQWLTRTAYFHELRHYHELVGSVCGFHLLLETTALADNFYRALRRESSHTLAIPLLKASPQHPAARIFAGYRDFLVVLLGDMPVQSFPEVKREIPVREFVSHLPRATLRYPLVAFRRRDHFSGRMNDLLVSVGLRSLMELTATEMQIVLAAIGAGADPDDPVDAEGRVRRNHSAWSTLLRSGFYCYWVARLFGIYRACDLVGGPVSLANTTPPLLELSAIAQAAMDFAGYAGYPDPHCGHAWEFEHPGIVYGHLLSHWHPGAANDLVEMVDSIAVAEQAIGRTYREFLEQYSRSLDTRAQLSTTASLAARERHQPAHRQVARGSFRDPS